MNPTGHHIIQGEDVAGRGQRFSARNPASGEILPPGFAEATEADVDACLRAADEAFETLQSVRPDQVAALLEAIADGLEDAGDALLERAHQETGLPAARLQGERGRTLHQTRLFAELVRRQDWARARIDPGDPERTPLPKPDVRSILIGIGPVVVFGAGNFPLAISVAGTDTISAFAARCPVVAKGHPGHPGTCEGVARVIVEALETTGLPSGMFSFLQGAGYEVGQALVRHPLTAAVAFTGSLQGGRALYNAAAARPHPIPVYAEMGSTNPLFLLPGAAMERATQIAHGYIQSVSLGVGQFCTNPGMVFAESGPGLDAFLAAAAAAAAATPPATMLHAGIHAAYEKGRHRMEQIDGVRCVASSGEAADNGALQAACTIFHAPADTRLRYPELREEVFGPSSIVFECEDREQMLRMARELDGQLTATIHGTESELKDCTGLIRVLERKAGRLIFNGFPTGIEVCSAMHHGGPYPAATHSHFTSIGQDSIYRFTRPVCFQDFPDSALPAALRNGNEHGIHRLVDGEYTRKKA